MDRTVCTECQCLYSTAIPLLPLWGVRPVQSLSACTVQLYLYSTHGPYGLYRASVPVQGCTLPFTLSIYRMFFLFHSCLTTFHLLHVLSVQFLSVYFNYKIFCMLHFCVSMFSSIALQPKVRFGQFNNSPPGKFRGFDRRFVTNAF